MSDFGDFDHDDAFDNEPADPEQVAIKLHKLRVENGLESIPWEEFSHSRRSTMILVVAALLAWMRRQGAI